MNRIKGKILSSIFFFLGNYYKNYIKGFFNIINKNKEFLHIFFIEKLLKLFLPSNKKTILFNPQSPIPL